MTELQKKVPLVLKIEDWPDEDRGRWAQLTAPGTLFSDGPFANWSDGTMRLRRQGYGQWLSYLKRHHHLELQRMPADRIRVETVRGFVDECRVRLKDRSTYNLVTCLVVLAMALGPAEDWAWLQRVQARLRRGLDDTALAGRHPIGANEIFEWSLLRLRDVDALEDVSDRQRAIWFRQALMIGFLISRPVRRRALLAMIAGLHITQTEEGYQLTFAAADMKDKQQHRYPLPAQLVAPMTRYLERHRRVLLADSKSAALWINQCGQPIMADGLAKELPKIKARHLGIALRPHAFRHIAATSIAEQDPEHVGVIRDILGHATLQMAEKHYNRAAGVSACNSHQVLIRNLKMSLAVAQKELK